MNSPLPEGSQVARPTEVRVRCYAGYRGEETPRSFTAGTETVAVVEILERWLEPDGRCFRVRGEGGGVYLLRHNEEAGRWQMTRPAGRRR